MKKLCEWEDIKSIDKTNLDVCFETIQQMEKFVYDNEQLIIDKLIKNKEADFIGCNFSSERFYVSYLIECGQTIGNSWPIEELINIMEEVYDDDKIDRMFRQLKTGDKNGGE